jgi:flagellar biosynthesis/type III secretory pathway M-ring protein FliF/YscJ
MMVPVVALALFVLFVLRPLVKFLTTPTQQEFDLSKLLPNELLNADSPAADSQLASAVGISHERESLGAQEGERRGTIDGLEPSIDLEQFEEVVAENVKRVKENPQQAALLIRYWLNDGRI